MIFHIDMSNHYGQKSYSVLALSSVNQSKVDFGEIHKAVIIEDPFRAKILEKYSDIELHAVLIFYLIMDIPKINKIVLCNDVRPFERVKNLLNILNPRLIDKIKSLTEIREELGDSTIKSAADSFARNVNRHYIKRNNNHRRKSYFDDGSILLIHEFHGLKLKSFIKKFKKIRNG